MDVVPQTPTATRLASAMVHMVCARIGLQMALYLQAAGRSCDPPALLGYWAALGHLTHLANQIPRRGTKCDVMV